MYRCKSPILLIGFNRPDYMVETLNSLRKVRPEKIYFAVDGPRHPDEKQKVTDTQECVKLIDWDCEIKTLFREKNLGCKHGVASAIDWVFKEEDFAIIVEDDILARSEFFQMCDMLNAKYAQNDRIYMISGTNYSPDPKHVHSYVYTQNFTIWGWATWKRCWKDYDVHMSGWENQDIQTKIRVNSPSWFQWQYWKRTLNNLNSNYMDTWDIQWVYHCIKNSGMAVTPTTNLVTNIGVDGAHSNTQTDSHYMDTQPLDLKKGGPSDFLVDAYYDRAIVQKKYVKLIILDFMKAPLRPLYKRLMTYFGTKS